MKWNFKYNSDSNQILYEHNILLVADPQLIGFNYENKLFGQVIRWDADRFLKSGFTQARKYSNPDIIVFLGDLFDEGEIATDLQFRNYFQRFQKIFLDSLPDTTLIIVLPGDNDIGGEYFTSRNNMIVSRFMNFFNISYPYLKSIDDINFIAADIQSTDDFRKTLDYVNSKSKISKVNVLFNHNSVHMDEKYFPYTPDIHLVVTAHSHLSEYKLCEICKEKSKRWTPTYKLESYNEIEFNLPTHSSKILEITVPTCSYRMGVPYPGYGFLKLSNNGNVSYKVLWLPYRFYCLGLYCCLLILMILIFLCNRCRSKCI